MISVASSVLSTATPSFKPALKPPPGVFSNPEHPETLKETSTIAVCICCVVTTLFFSARCYCRYWIRSTFIFEDVMATIAWICAIVNAALVAVTMHRHGGMHAWDITIVQFREASFWFNIVAVQYGIAVCLTKITVLMLYRRVFSTTRRSVFDMSVVSLIIILSLFYGITTFFKIFECNPRAKMFDSSIPGHCYDIGKILKTSGAFNTISDYVILLLPIHAVYKLQMKKRKKLLVILVFTFGLCAPAFATIGFVVRLQRSSNKDTSWGQPTILLWGLAELTSGSLCISFPEMGPLLRSSTRHHSRNTPRRPTASELNPYKEPSGLSYRLRKKIQDPFLATSLFGTRGTSTLNETESYIQLNDVKTDSQGRSGEIAEPRPVRIMVDTEINVKTHEAI